MFIDGQNRRNSIEETQFNGQVCTKGETKILILSAKL